MASSLGTVDWEGKIRVLPGTTTPVGTVRRLRKGPLDLLFTLPEESVSRRCGTVLHVMLDDDVVSAVAVRACARLHRDINKRKRARLFYV